MYPVDIQLDANASEAQEYLEKHHIREVMESIVVGLTFQKPEDPLTFVDTCVQRIRDQDLISNHPSKERIRWNTFLPEAKAVRKTNYGISRRGGLVDVLVPFQRQLPSNPLINQALPSIKRNPMTGKAWKNIVFVLGGPGSGKGTQCSKLAEEFNYTHISVGDVLRDEVLKDTNLGKEIGTLMNQGKMVASEIVLRMLKKVMQAKDNASGFLIDGYPRSIDQVVEFEQSIAKPKFVLFYECDLEILETRLLKRGETSGRSDDNIDVIRKRFVTYKESSVPTIEYFIKQQKCHKILSNASIEEVYHESRQFFMDKPINHKNLVFVLGGPGSGKGTQCSKLVKEFDLIHLSTGDLLREQVEKQTEIGLAAENLMRQGQMVPSEYLMQILREKIEENDKAKGFLIDGFPRSMDQAIDFEKKIGPCRAVLAFRCCMDTLRNRLLKRGETSGRSDDNLEAIQKRFVTFETQSEPVIDHFVKRGKCTLISSEKSVAEVYEDARKLFLDPTPLNHPNVIFILGPPGVGRSTQCANIAREFKYKHISTGELLRKEILKQTPIGLQVENYLANGKTAPMDIVFFLLKQEIARNMNGTGILFDGFPAKVDQALEFERIIGKPRAVISLNGPENILKARIEKKGQDELRSDDNQAVLSKRFETFRSETAPVLDYYNNSCMLYKFESSQQNSDEVYKEIKKRFPLERPIKPTLVICGPPGSGVSTMLNKLFVKYPGIFGYSISHTTRQPRSAEVDGVHYHFTTREEFKRMQLDEEFIETNEFNGNLYGTSIDSIRAVENANKICVLDLDYKGVMTFKEKGIPSQFVFIRPTSVKDLEGRIRLRGTETEEAITAQLLVAHKIFDYASKPNSFDATIINDDEDTAFKALETFAEKTWRLDSI